MSNAPRSGLPLIRDLRRGTALVELMMVITLSALLMVGTARIISGLMSAQSRAGEQMQEGRSRSRFAEQFREDAHSARQANIGDERTTCTLTLSDGAVVRYESVADGVTRSAAEKSGQPPHRDSFRGSATECRFEIDTDRGLVRAVFCPSHERRAAALAVESRATDRIDAALGLLVAQPVTRPETDRESP